jgi:hypothetical protein
MSPSGEETTLPVQWCEVNVPSEVPNSVPTCATPENSSPVSGSDTRIELAVVAVAVAVAVAVVDGEVGAEGVAAEALAPAGVFAAALLVATAWTAPELASLSRPSTFA